MRPAILVTGIAALFLAIGSAHAQSGYRPNYDPNAHEWQSSEPGYSDKRPDGDEKNCSPLKPRTLSKKPLTPKQVREYRALRSIGIDKKDAAQVVRDPGVKKGEWGWTRVGGASEGVMCVKNEGSERLMKYRNNVVIE
jgi:hypothetical protein